jgi:dienelactone hydrolase
MTNGAMHVMHLAVSGSVSGSDVTGVVAAACAVVLLGMSALLPFLHRGERRATRRRTWTVRVLVTATVAGGAAFVLLPVAVGIGQTHLFRAPVGSPPDGRFESVSFSSSDGLELSGWYAPSANGAAVLLVSSARGDRSATVDHAVMLAEHGYGVLLYDARGTGRSEGTPNGYGWGWHRDVTGALDFLGRRADVDPSRIGGLGLSTGADVLIEVAAEDPRLAAVVADGATIRSLADIPSDQSRDVVMMAPVLVTAQLLSGEEPGAPLDELIAEASPTPFLLVAAGSIGPEIKVNRRYAEAAGPTAELWALPDARHTAAIRDEAAEYERRVVAHFADAL